jgi:uncharacterized protein YdaL
MKLFQRIALTCLVATAAWFPLQPAQAQTTAIKTLVLYDAPTTGDYRKLAYAYDASTLTVNADPEIGQTQVVDAAKATEVATIRNPKTGETAPYMVRSGNFWYVADLPFSYIGPRDRYLVICDALHDMLGVTTATNRRALVRLEDVGALVDPPTMRTLSDYLYNKKVPFSVATIPFYRDPLGAYNSGVPMEIHLAQATDLKKSLNYALQRGGTIVMHGYTHQYNSMPNKFNAVSGDDWEFWDATHNTPTGDESVETTVGSWAGARLDKGLTELKNNGYTAFAWEAPHYQSSATSIRAAAKRFKTTYQRVVYYTADKPNLTTASGDRDYAVGQFFPYVINSDFYGQRVLPEGLGNIEYDISDIDPNSGQVYTAGDILTNARKMLLVRDGFASFFFHPFWLESDMQARGIQGFGDFKKVVEGISGLGFTWVNPSQL